MIHQRMRYSSYEEYADVEMGIRHPNSIDIGNWQWSEEGELFTPRAGTSIVIAAHNQNSQRGLVGHFGNIASADDEPTSHQNMFHHALEQVESLGELAATAIWMCGGAPNIAKDGSDANRGNRVYAERYLRRYIAELDTKPEVVVVEWSGEGRMVDVDLDCMTGILVVHNYPNEEQKVNPAGFRA